MAVELQEQPWKSLELYGVKVLDCKVKAMQYPPCREVLKQLSRMLTGLLTSQKNIRNYSSMLQELDVE